MQCLSSHQAHELMARFPEIELSYETTPHRKVSSDYDLCMGIPVGKKCLLWYTFYGEKDVCFMIELNREKKPGHIYLIHTNTHLDIKTHSLSYGTVFHGTWMDGSIACVGINSSVHIAAVSVDTQSHVFLIDDVLVYKGTPTKQIFFSEKLGMLANYFESAPYCQHVHIAMATLFPSNIENESFDPVGCVTQYPLHHVQYRALNQTLPYLNVIPVRKYKTTTTSMQVNNIKTNDDSLNQISRRPISMALYKPQYKSPTVFVVGADTQYDIYHLYAYGRGKELVYCGVAYISNYHTSVFMNGIFRKIKENACLDAIEESDDEDDFENTEVDKYVDLKKRVNMECVFHSKFKKWVPKKIANRQQKVVHVSAL